MRIYMSFIKYEKNQMIDIFCQIVRQGAYIYPFPQSIES